MTPHLIAFSWGWTDLFLPPFLYYSFCSFDRTDYCSAPGSLTDSDTAHLTVGLPHLWVTGASTVLCGKGALGREKQGWYVHLMSLCLQELSTALTGKTKVQVLATVVSS